MKRIYYDKTSAWCNHARYLNGKIYFLSMFGTQTSVKALWAAVASSTKEKLRFQVSGTDYQEYLGRDESKYHTISTALPEKNMLHLLYINCDATNQIQGLDATQFVVMGDTPENIFFPKLNRRCNVPMLKEWKTYLWLMGQDKKIVSPLDGFGMPGYIVSTDQEAWHNIIKEGITRGELQWQD